MLNTQNRILQRNSLRIPRKFIVIAGSIVVVALVLGLLSRVDGTATKATSAAPVSGFICPSGEAQITRYAGQSVSMGCACQSGYNLVRGENAALGSVEWEICK